MAVGGYKCVSFTWSGGRTDSALDRCQYVLHGFCSAIVSAQLGWEWDTDFNDGTIGDYKVMGGHSSSSPNIAYILKLIYNQHVYRWCVGLNYRNLTSFRTQDCVYYCSSNNPPSYYNFQGGLYSGVIKDGTFTYDSTYGYIPGDTGQFLKWMHFAPWASANAIGSSAGSFVWQNNSSFQYGYYALIKNDQVVVFYKSSEWNSYASSTARLKGYMFGELFKETAHTNDLNTFACIYLCTFVDVATVGEIGNTLNGKAGSTSGTSACSFINATNNNVTFWYNQTSSPFYSVNTTCSQIFTASGSKLEGMNSNTNDRVQLKYDAYPVNDTVSTVQNNPGGGRWTPCFVYYFTGDQQTYGVVQGDSFKGYLDTDLIRGVNPNYTKGQTLGDNAEFLYLGGGFAIGWDASNTVTMF